MLAYRFLVTCCLATVTLACSEPQCPAGYMKYGNQCRRCKPGEVRERGQCVPELDGAVEPITEEPDAGEEPPEGAEPAPDAGDMREEDGTSSEDDGDTSEEDEGTSDPDAKVDAGLPCYRDEDRDGVGAGEPIDCVPSDGSRVATTNTDCDDTDPNRPPSLSDVCGDKIDNDCDGTADNESNNACGGPCSMQLGHQPGEPCSNGLKGACARSGVYECSSVTATKCNAPFATGSGELCGDAVDNDCDGAIDEADAVDVRTWFQDCDGDGFAASTVGSVKACEMPQNAGTCGWTATIPQPETHTNWDCNDRSSAYSPAANYGFPPSGSSSWDLNCDGQLTPSPTAPPQACSDTLANKVSASRRPTLDDCDELPGVGVACYVWEAPGGAYASAPGTACPDAGYPIYLIFTLVESNPVGCEFNPQAAPASKWPCR